MNALSKPAEPPYLAQLKTKDSKFYFVDYDRSEHKTIEKVVIFCNRAFIFTGSDNEYGKPSKKHANDGPLLRVVLHYEEADAWRVKDLRNTKAKA